MKKLLLNSVLLTAGLGIYTEANAACAPTSGFTTKVISMAVGRVVVRPSDEVGKVLRKATFAIDPNNSTINCSPNSSGTVKADLIQSYPVSSQGSNIYTTNIPGIGIRLYREAQNNANFSGYYPYSRNITGGWRGTNYSLDSGYFVVEIVKTAEQTGSGALVPGQYSSYYLTSHQSRPILTSHVLANAITIASSSCELQGNINKVVQLPTVMKSGFSGIGSTQGEQSFDLNILCNGGINPTGYEEKNLISLDFDFPQDGNNSEVMTNTAPSSARANGVGVQLFWKYQSQNKLIRKGDKLQVGTVNSNQTVQYNIPLSARYYQTATNVTAGRVQAMATVTIQYD
ncbi:fimbrial protein [Acinetobacter baumannii]|uniref:fimbrial protein n=1 Tax=Acinetobacter calcoaceticus/baumannii complex TaxID=909768 RepID=UPI00112BEE6C|nr:fimbrial protein [Acinetobacter baumannii]MBD0483745.1 fimbrial protein [Acinetobacter baumannii]MDI7712925.1 fimbrial protein [Acinetobacter baumannii]MDV4229762.1 fimbrial protein [Acinetobacter baumannii]TPS39864.1 type 1 fimbrial protein [Acinetobacter baumannii]HDU8503782.1 fimbrial protein [Acinetobacter baumannii]